ncbi:uncharacterized protein LOC114352734 [Ostrinia furnacalis]|uniref:uncharacterized protein LOC114352734 n=1 Tax=Ostrinia furnacalis TaxID=93504 RepID=UPI00103E2CED|nr:uncharacterized protein LOC114352734 [Ostrinia furnacalis]
MGSPKYLLLILFCWAYLVLKAECLPKELAASDGDTKAGLLELCKDFIPARANKVLCLVCKGFDITCLFRSTTTIAPTTTPSTTPSTTTTEVTTTTTPAPPEEE